MIDPYLCQFYPVLHIRSIYISLHAWQDHEPLIAMPAQDEHMERRAQEVSEALGKDGNNDYACPQPPGNMFHLN